MEILKEFLLYVGEFIASGARTLLLVGVGMILLVFAPARFRPDPNAPLTLNIIMVRFTVGLVVLSLFLTILGGTTGLESDGELGLF